MNSIPTPCKQTLKFYQDIWWAETENIVNFKTIKDKLFVHLHWTSSALCTLSKFSSLNWRDEVGWQQTPSRPFPVETSPGVKKCPSNHTSSFRQLYQGQQAPVLKKTNFSTVYSESSPCSKTQCVSVPLSEKIEEASFGLWERKWSEEWRDVNVWNIHFQWRLNSVPYL